ncbi:MAG: helix-turn-helix domain-containing protein [Thaumarchaeota archaeon]|nr:helix-turn-helix domain-containing protein [Nitrososphaerota archaeon]
MSNNWSEQVSNEAAARRAGGRRKYNWHRQNAALLRQMEILDWWMQSSEAGTGIFSRGVQAALARRFGVSRSTICRDYVAILRLLGVSPCPTCDSPLMRARWEQLVREGKIAITDPSGHTERKGNGPSEGHEPNPPDHANDFVMRLAAQELARRQADLSEEDVVWSVEDD